MKHGKKKIELVFVSDHANGHEKQRSHLLRESNERYFVSSDDLPLHYDEIWQQSLEQVSQIVSEFDENLSVNVSYLIFHCQRPASLSI